MTTPPPENATSWWERRLSRNTLYSLATGALAIAFGATGVVSLLIGDLTSIDKIVTTLGVLASAVIAPIVFTQGRRLHKSAGMILILTFLFIGIVHIWVGVDRHNVFIALQEVPIFALFVAGFYRPVTARLFAFVMLVLVSGAMLFGNLGGMWTASSVGPANLPSTIIFVVICCEAGIVIQAWFDEKTTVDVLTGALNRAGFMDAARAELRRAERSGSVTSVALVDIDAFKHVNDTRGHAAGDALLQDLVRQWRSLTRTNDVVGRLGGDEFILLFPDTPLRTAEMVVERLRARSPHPWSYGVTEVRGDEDLSDVVHRADLAMYRSRRTS